MGTAAFKEERVEADLLCIGGGIAGLMAAIGASELGAKVVVAEKGNSLRSGNAATGIDHFRCYIPELHGDIEPMVDALQRSQQGGLRPRDYLREWMERSLEIVKLWESWDLPMKKDDKYVFQGHGLKGQPMMNLHFSGRDLKVTLTREALKRGVKILNRVMVCDLLLDGGPVGALGIGTRDEKIIAFQAKSIFLGTGPCARLYPGPTPGWMYNLRNSPNSTGDGRAMAYRSGADLVNLEIPVRRCGPKYFARAGKGTWAGVVRDPLGKPIGPFVEKPDGKTGDPVVDYFQSVFRDYAKTGKGPLYMDCRGVTKEDYEDMLYFMAHEGNSGLLNYWEDEGIDIRKNPVEFMTYDDFFVRGGISFNKRGETSVKGLYAAGDEFGGGGSAAAIFGWIAGENAARYSESAQSPNIEKARAKAEEKVGLIREMRRQNTGATWKEANVCLQQLMTDYAGPIRSEFLLEAGLTYLRRLKEKASKTLMANNQHELMRCLEVVNLIEIGELIHIAADVRKETRGEHVRSDYPLTNPEMAKLLIIKKADGKPSSEWREVRT